MPVAYLSPSLLQDLTNVSVSPGAGNTGYPLVWNNTSGRFELAVLGVAGGGTGTSNGSITGTGALTFAAGGTSEKIILNPSGTGSGTGDVEINGFLNLNVPAHQASFRGVRMTLTTGANYSNGLNLIKGQGYASLINFTSDSAGFSPGFQGRSTMPQPSFKFVGNQNTALADSVLGVLNFDARNSTDTGALAGSLRAVVFSNLDSVRWTMLGNGNISQIGTLTVSNTTESTSTTTGAISIDGGLGVAKNINVGGNLRFAGGTVPATATSAGTAGDIRYDGSHLYICTATNTWARTAVSTW